MPAVSQEGWGALVEFANHYRQPPAPGIQIIDTPRYRITLQPDFPIPGPNGVSWIRCPAGEADGMITEVRSTVAPHHLPIMWTLDPETEPSDFADYLAALGVEPDARAPEAAVMVLSIEAALETPEVEGLELHDALADAASFRTSDAVNAEAFGSTTSLDDARLAAARERRRLNQLEAGNRRVILATVDGEPAGSAGMTLFPPSGAIINGGAVRPKFRGRGVYRALVAERLRMARDAGVPGLSVWAAHATSAPILARLGFEAVGWRRFYPDSSTA